jgi:hypothetical protein
VSYLNLMERNQRPVTAQVLLRMAEAYDLDLRSLSGDSDEHAVVELAEVFADPLFRDIAIPRHELVELANVAPSASEAIGRLYRALVEARRRAELAQSQSGDRDDPAEALDPVAFVRDRVQEHRNHFPDLDAAAEAVAAELNASGQDLFAALRERLRERHQVQVRILPFDVLPNSLRRFDRHRRQLLISELVDGPGRLFAAAFQIALIEFGALVDTLVERANTADTGSRRLYKVNLVNYAAAAIIMPYQRFFEAAEAVGYEIAVLQARFAASFEQVCHRLTTLSRPTARGVPFFMIRVDSAGNVSKRFAAGSFPFSKFGGTCPLWNVHSTFKSPGRVFTQVLEMPDGARYFSIARTVRRVTSSFTPDDPEIAVGVGCELKFASRLVQARDLDLAAVKATPIGINCRLCERPACSQRAAPPMAKALIVDETLRGLSPFRFEVI